MKRYSLNIIRVSFCAALVLLLTGCDKLLGGSGSDFTVENFAFQEEEDGKWGIMDMDGNVLVKPKFDASPTCAINGMFSVYDNDESTYTLYAMGEKPKKIGTYTDIGGFTGKLCPVVDKNGNVKYIDTQGNKVLDLKKMNGKKVLQAYNFFNGRAMIMLENKKWGYINESGEVAIPIKFADAWNFADGLAIVYHNLPDDGENGKWSVIDTDGNILFTKKFKDMTPSSFRFSGEYLAVTDKNERTAIINRQGEVVKKLKEDMYVSTIADDIFVAYNSETEKYSLMSFSGETLIKDKYNTLYYNGKILIGSNGPEKNYLINTKGEKQGRLPEGYVILFEKEFKNYDKRMLIGNSEDGYLLLDGDGNELNTESDINNYNNYYYWGVTVPGMYDEYDGEYDEEEEYDEDEDAVG